MENYNNSAKRFIAYHREKTLADKQISAITTALIGAVAEGYKVETLDYNKDDLKALDLTAQKEIFNESGKTVEELESSLVAVHETLRLSSLYLQNELDALKIHYSMCPKCFLSKYIFVPNHVISRLGEGFQTEISKTLSESIDEGALYSMMTNEDGVMIFCERNNNMEKIKKYLTIEDDVLSYDLNELEIDNTTQYFLGYLYIQQHEGKKEDGKK